MVLLCAQVEADSDADKVMAHYHVLFQKDVDELAAADQSTSAMAELWLDQHHANASARAGLTKNGIRYSPYTIKFCLYLLAKGGNAAYDVFSSVLHLPSIRTLHGYKHFASNDVDRLHAIGTKFADMSAWQRSGKCYRSASACISEATVISQRAPSLPVQAL